MGYTLGPRVADKVPHAVTRMAQRGITLDKVAACVRFGTKFWDPINQSIYHALGRARVGVILNGVIKGSRSRKWPRNPNKNGTARRWISRSSRNKDTMIVHIDDIARLLLKSNLPQQGVPPDDILAIVFGPDTRRSVESDEYDRIDEGSMVIDWDKDHNIVSIELFNIPFDYQHKQAIEEDKRRSRS